MSTHKLFDFICVVVLLLTIAITVLFINGERLGIEVIVDEDAESYSGSAYFTQNDLAGEWTTDGATVITLKGESATVSGGGAYAYNGDVVITGAGRYVLSGMLTDGSVIVDDDVIDKIRICCDYAPLHNPAHLLGIEAVSNVLPEITQVVTFDTAFHQTMEPAAYMYALPYEYYSKYRVRRYGAHGTSHLYVSHEGAAFAGIDINNSKIITCHIGNGSSVTAIKNGKSVDTSMGFTPLEGMIMGTRCGTMDPNVVTYLMKKEGLTPDQMTDIMNKKSGFLGMSEGVTSDCRDLVDRREAGDKRAKLILDKLVLDITKLVGGYIAEMNGVDLIVFTAGIAENNPWIRRDVCANFGYMGIEIDEEVNAKARRDNAIISTPASKVKVAMIPTDEELVIARDTMHLAEGRK